MLPRKIFKQTVRFRAFWDDFKQYFRFFLETFFGILYFDLARKHCNGKKKKL